MFCPNCGNDCVDEKFCPECGNAVFLTEDTDKIALSIGRYEGVDGYIELSYYTVKIHKSGGVTPNESILAYDDIIGISYQEPSKEGIGYFVIRHVDQCGKSVSSEEDAACDETSLLFTEEQSSIFKDICVCLKGFLAKKKPGRRSMSRHLPRKKGICCPQCGSQSFTIYRFPRHIPPAIRNPYCRLLSNLLVLYSVVVLEGKKMKCLDCGYIWFP